MSEIEINVLENGWKKAAGSVAAPPAYQLWRLNLAAHYEKTIGDFMNKLIKGKSLMAVLILAATMIGSPAMLHAQITGELEAKIPFEFHVENTRLPAGEYFISPADEFGTAILEVENANYKVSVFATTINKQMTQAPKISELVFDKIGSRYFLREITVQDSLMGYDIPPSKVETSLSKGSVKVEQHRLTVNHHKTKTRKH